MNSFFSRISDYFDASYAGRYETIILAEIANECPDIIKCIYRKFKPSLHQVDLEYCYQAGRRADFTIRDIESGEPVFLLEIKCEDKPLDGQLESYIYYVKSHKNTEFLYLTKHLPSSEDLQKISKNPKHAKHMLFSEFLSILLKKDKIQNNPFGKAYLQYLKEEGYMYEKLDEDSVKKLLVRFFLPNGRNGAGSIRSAENMLVNFPDSFRNLLNNMSILNDEIKPFFDGKRISIDFSMHPQTKENDDDWNKIGGYFYVYAYGPIFNDGKNWVNVEYGIELTIERVDKKPRMESFVYGKIYSKNEYEYRYSSAKFNVFSDKKKMVNTIKKKLIDALSAGLKKDEIKQAKAEIKNALKKLKA